jgi:hypothetical protein
MKEMSIQMRFSGCSLVASVPLALNSRDIKGETEENISDSEKIMPLLIQETKF